MRKSERTALYNSLKRPLLSSSAEEPADSSPPERQGRQSAHLRQSSSRSDDVVFRHASTRISNGTNYGTINASRHASAADPAGRHHQRQLSHPPQRYHDHPQYQSSRHDRSGNLNSPNSAAGDDHHNHNHHHINKTNNNNNNANSSTTTGITYHHSRSSSSKKHHVRQLSLGTTASTAAAAAANSPKTLSPVLTLPENFLVSKFVQKPITVAKFSIDLDNITRKFLMQYGASGVAWNFVRSCDAESMGTEGLSEATMFRVTIQKSSNMPPVLKYMDCFADRLRQEQQEQQQQQNHPQPPPLHARPEEKPHHKKITATSNGEAQDHVDENDDDDDDSDLSFGCSAATSDYDDGDANAGDDGSENDDTIRGTRRKRVPFPKHGMARHERSTSGTLPYSTSLGDDSIVLQSETDAYRSTSNDSSTSHPTRKDGKSANSSSGCVGGAVGGKPTAGGGAASTTGGTDTTSIASSVLAFARGSIEAIGKRLSGLTGRSNTNRGDCVPPDVFVVKHYDTTDIRSPSFLVRLMRLATNLTAEHMARAEVQFYSLARPVLYENGDQFRAPYVYFIAEEDRGEPGCLRYVCCKCGSGSTVSLAMEDLSDAGFSFTQNDGEGMADFEVICQCVRSAAHLHSVMWGRPTSDERFKKVPSASLLLVIHHAVAGRFSLPSNYESVDLVALVKEWAEYFPLLQLRSVLAAALDIQRNWQAIRKRAVQILSSRRTLVHGDYHFKNIAVRKADCGSQYSSGNSVRSNAGDDDNHRNDNGNNNNNNNNNNNAAVPSANAATAAAATEADARCCCRPESSTENHQQLQKEDDAAVMVTENAKASSSKSSSSPSSSSGRFLDASSICAVDFQQFGAGSGIAELAYFIATSLPCEILATDRCEDPIWFLQINSMAMSSSPRKGSRGTPPSFSGRSSRTASSFSCSRPTSTSRTSSKEKIQRNSNHNNNTINSNSSNNNNDPQHQQQQTSEGHSFAGSSSIPTTTLSGSSATPNPAAHDHSRQLRRSAQLQQANAAEASEKQGNKTTVEVQVEKTPPNEAERAGDGEEATTDPSLTKNDANDGDGDDDRDHHDGDESASRTARITDHDVASPNKPSTTPATADRVGLRLERVINQSGMSHNDDDAVDVNANEHENDDDEEEDVDEALYVCCDSFGRNQLRSAGVSTSKPVTPKSGSSKPAAGAMFPPTMVLSDRLGASVSGGGVRDSPSRSRSSQLNARSPLSLATPKSSSRNNNNIDTSSSSVVMNNSTNSNTNNNAPPEQRAGQQQQLQLQQGQQQLSISREKDAAARSQNRTPSFPSTPVATSSAERAASYAEPNAAAAVKPGDSHLSSSSPETPSKRRRSSSINNNNSGIPVSSNSVIVDFTSFPFLEDMRRFDAFLMEEYWSALSPEVQKYFDDDIRCAQEEFDILIDNWFAMLMLDMARSTVAERRQLKQQPDLLKVLTWAEKTSARILLMAASRRLSSRSGSRGSKRSSQTATQQ